MTSMSEYHALKALSASGVDTLVNDCPWKFWQSSPWNPAFVPETANHFDIGTAAHLAVLEPEQYAARVVEIAAEDYKTKLARELRDEAYAAGKTPILDKERTIVDNIAERIFAQAGSYFAGGEAEVSLTWNWDGVLCKARPDYLIRPNVIVDLKTTMTANPRAIARKAFNEGWHVRAVWYKEAVSRTGSQLRAAGIYESGSPVPRIPIRYLFVVVEVKPPHLVQIFEMDGRSEAWAQQQIVRGLRLFQDCMAKDDWPAYGTGVQPLSLPNFAEYQLADREQAGEFSTRPTAEQVARATEWLEPNP